MQIREHLEVIDKKRYLALGLAWKRSRMAESVRSRRILHAWESDTMFSPQEKNQHVFYSSKTIFTEITAVFRIGGQISGFPDGEAEFARCLSP